MNKAYYYITLRETEVPDHFYPHGSPEPIRWYKFEPGMTLPKTKGRFAYTKVTAMLSPMQATIGGREEMLELYKLLKQRIRESGNNIAPAFIPIVAYLRKGTCKTYGYLTACEYKVLTPTRFQLITSIGCKYELRIERVPKAQLLQRVL